MISNLLHMSAAFGFAPEGVTTSLGMYMIYFACSGCEFIFDAKTSKPVKASAYDVFQSLWRLLRVGIINTFFFSYLAHFDYMPFGRDRTHYLDPNHLGNCFCIALFFQQVMAYGDAFFSLIANAIFGLKTAKMMDNPVLKSKSIAEFWGRRWNYLFHCVLKVRLLAVLPFVVAIT